MPCYFPIRAYRSPKEVAFYPIPDSSQIQLPCGRCIGCRLERSRQWAVRLVHENRLHECSSFITLTYRDDKLPPGGSLRIKDFQDFMKRFRKDQGTRLRFFHCGEYGEKRRRPHYHAIIFGESFDDWGDCYDVERAAKGDIDYITWSSRRLDRLWPFGLNRVGRVTFESCAYVARYVTKKITGPAARVAYDVVDYTTGEVTELAPEYATMSRRPGIGAGHFEKYWKHIYSRDEIAINGKLCKPPRFYDRCLEKKDRIAFLNLKDCRESALMAAPKYDRTDERLAEREVVKQAQIRALRRNYEIG